MGCTRTLARWGGLAAGVTAIGFLVVLWIWHVHTELPTADKTDDVLQLISDLEIVKNCLQWITVGVGGLSGVLGFLDAMGLGRWWAHTPEKTEGKDGKGAKKKKEKVPVWKPEFWNMTLYIIMIVGAALMVGATFMAPGISSSIVSTVGASLIIFYVPFGIYYAWDSVTIKLDLDHWNLDYENVKEDGSMQDSVPCFQSGNYEDNDDAPGQPTVAWARQNDKTADGSTIRQDRIPEPPTVEAPPAAAAPGQPTVEAPPAAAAQRTSAFEVTWDSLAIPGTTTRIQKKIDEWAIDNDVTKESLKTFVGTIVAVENSDDPTYPGRGTIIKEIVNMQCECERGILNKKTSETEHKERRRLASPMIRLMDEINAAA